MKNFGKLAENYVLNFFLQKNFTLISKNYRYKKFEIDIILKKNDLILFIEVKARKNNKYGNPEEFLSESQKNRIHLAAENFLFETKWEKNIRFDIASIFLDENKNFILEIFEDAF